MENETLNQKEQENKNKIDSHTNTNTNISSMTNEQESKNIDNFDNIDNKDNIVNINSPQKKENSLSNNDNPNKDNNNFDLNQQQKKYDIGKIIEITDDMIFKNSHYEDYDEIIELDLSKQNIASFMNNRNIPFQEFTELQILNLSYNWMTYTYDIRFFKKLKELYINDNKVDDLSFCESLPHLEILNAENNQISFITSLNKCTNLKILKLSLNKIEFLKSTLNTFKNLKKLQELTIKDNPFLTQLFAYKQYFIYNYQNILKLDEEEINDIDRDIAGRFVRENNPIYKNTTQRPMSSRPEMCQKVRKAIETDENLKKINENNEEDEMAGNNNIFSQTQTTFRVGNAIITKEMYVPYKGKDKTNITNQKLKDNNIINKDDKNQKLKEIIKEQKKEIDNITLELENINQLNKEYKIMIDDYKIKIEQKKNAHKKNNSIINKKDNEKNKLLRELEMWKKEYYDLFNKASKSTTFLSKNIKKPKLLSNNLIKKYFDNNFNKKDDIDINLYKSTPNNEMKKNINRPQTAKINSTKSTDFEKLCEGIKIMYSKNDFADVLEEESNDEDKDGKNKRDKDENIELNNDDNKNNEIINNKNNNLIGNEPIFDDDKNEDEKDYDGNDIIPDDEIDELFRKSCADLQKMREDIKYMNESIDKSNKNNTTINNNSTYKGGKTKLNPVIIKKENNPNYIGNKGFFGNINQKKI